MLPSPVPPKVAERKEDHVRSFDFDKEPLCAPVEPPMPDGLLLQALSVAYADGRTDKRYDGKWLTHKRMIRLHTRYLEDWRRLIGDSIGALSAMQAAFYIGLDHHHPDFVERVGWQCMTQHCLTRAFARLPTDSSWDLLQAFSRLNLSEGEWKRVYTGTLAVARAAYAFAWLGVESYLSSVWMDIKDKIDLICQRHDPFSDRRFVPGQGGLCLQIKGDASSQATIFERAMVQADPSGWGYCLASDFVRGVIRFQRDDGGIWQAVHLAVGQGRYARSAEVRQCSEIKDAVLEELKDAGLTF